MYDTINFNAFNNWFEQSDQYKNNFSYEARKALFEYLDELDGAVTDEADTNSCLGIKFDPIAFCCEYSEYENIQAFWKDYNQEDYPTIEKIEDNTTVIKIPDSEKFIIEAF
tara:strand:+ start:123 stop:455 length:333 start_codon:yes stop_codon:yes gene_type:complete